MTDEQTPEPTQWARIEIDALAKNTVVSIDGEDISNTLRGISLQADVHDQPVAVLKLLHVCRQAGLIEGEVKIEHVCGLDAADRLTRIRGELITKLEAALDRGVPSWTVEVDELRRLLDITEGRSR